MLKVVMRKFWGVVGGWERGSMVEVEDVGEKRSRRGVRMMRRILTRSRMVCCDSRLK